MKHYRLFLAWKNRPEGRLRRADRLAVIAAKHGAA